MKKLSIYGLRVISMIELSFNHIKLGLKISPIDDLTNLIDLFDPNFKRMITT